jgi:hypothetical protein
METGYFSEANVTALTALGCTPLIPPDRQLHGQAVPMAPRGRPPAGLSVANRMRRTLRTRRGRRSYARRTAIVEPVFGQIKQGRGYRQFLLRGMRQVRGEWALICTMHNVLKLWTALRRQRQRHGEGLRARRGERKATRKGPREHADTIRSTRTEPDPYPRSPFEFAQINVGQTPSTSQSRRLELF